MSLIRPLLLPSPIVNEKCAEKIYLKFYFTFTAGCENGCSRHGQCTLEDGEYHCNCIDGWAGSDCSIPLEMICDDGVDNDEGKMIGKHTKKSIKLKAEEKFIKFNLILI